MPRTKSKKRKRKRKRNDNQSWDMRWTYERIYIRTNVCKNVTVKI